jgi:hypothetical protein
LLHAGARAVNADPKNKNKMSKQKKMCGGPAQKKSIAMRATLAFLLVLAPAVTSTCTSDHWQ